MMIFHPLLGMIDIPEDEEEIRDETRRCRNRLMEMKNYDRYLQARIDCLESELSEITQAGGLHRGRNL
jgi:hypothetical protein